MKKTLTKFALATALLVPFAFAAPASAATVWDTTGSYVVGFQLTGDPTVYAHDAVLSQDAFDAVTGSGGYPAGGPYGYAWTITGGTVVDDTISLAMSYTLGAVCDMTMIGTIALDGSMSGTWSDNCGGPRTGTWSTTSGAAVSTSPEVHIFKYVDGVQATAANADSSAFPMLTTFNSSVYGLVTDAPFTLSPTGWAVSDDPYEASYLGGAAGDDYATREVLTTSIVGASCDGSKDFRLIGYSTGGSLAAAEAAGPSATEPSFTNLQSDKYVIVWNSKCVPSVPVITSPSNNMCVTSANQQLIDWTNSTGGVNPITYQYQAFSDSAYTASVYDSGMTLASSQIPTPGTPAGTYYIRVRAQDGNGTLSDWSNGSSNPYKIVVGPDTFTWSQLLSPLNISGKTYNTGSTIPVKVQIKDGCGVGVNKGLPTLTIKDSSSATVSTGPFRFDSSAGQYIFNWSTKVPTMLPTGTYTITVDSLAGVTDPAPTTAAILVK